MEVKKRAIILLVLLAIVLAGAIYFYPKQDSSSVTSSLDNVQDVLLSSDVVDVSLSTLNEEYSVNLKRGDIAYLKGQNVNTKARLINLNMDKAMAIVRIEGYGEAVINQGDKLKIDLNDDDSYDLIVAVNSVTDFEASLFFMAINEKKTVLDTVSAGFDSALESLEERSQLQSYVIFSVFIVLLIILLAYVFKTYIMPIIRMRKINERKEAHEVLYELIQEIRQANKTSDQTKIEGLKKRIKHLYEYLSEEEKIRAKRAGVERYIN